MQKLGGRKEHGFKELCVSGLRQCGRGSTGAEDGETGPQEMCVSGDIAGCLSEKQWEVIEGCAAQEGVIRFAFYASSFPPTA